MLFNRTSDGPLVNEIEQARLSKDVTVARRILAANLRRDGRVNSARGAKFVDDTDAFLTTERASTKRNDPPADFKAGLKQYIFQNAHWSVGSLPEYITVSNDNNRVSGVIQRTRLYTVVDPIEEIGNMENAFRRIREELPKSTLQEEAVAFFPKGLNYAALDNALKINFPGQRNSLKPSPIQTKLIRVILTLMGTHAEFGPSPPRWATTDAFGLYLSQTPERWLQVLGLRPREERLLFVLAYRLSDLGSLRRPTHLEVRSYSHFPSPNDHPCGLAMELHDAANPNTLPLLEEYIHRDLPFESMHWDAAEYAWGWTPNQKPLPTPERMRHYREAHWSRLGTERICGKNTQDWWDLTEVLQPCDY